MKSEVTIEFIQYFAELPERVKKTARKNYQLWKQDPSHPSLEFKKFKPSISLIKNSRSIFVISV
jgi:hypothetical protein